MPFLNPKHDDEDDDALSGAPGLHLDLDTRTCPQCRRETPPWQPRCPDCGVPTVAVETMPPLQFDLPDLDDPPHAGADEAEE